MTVLASNPLHIKGLRVRRIFLSGLMLITCLFSLLEALSCSCDRVFCVSFCYFSGFSGRFWWKKGKKCLREWNATESNPHHIFGVTVAKIENVLLKLRSYTFFLQECLILEPRKWDQEPNKISCEPVLGIWADWTLYTNVLHLILLVFIMLVWSKQKCSNWLLVMDMYLVCS